MPITPANLAPSIAGGLASGGMIGVSVPQLAAGLAAGLSVWVQQIVVATSDFGTLGVGAGTLPFIVPLGLLTGPLLASFPSSGIAGVRGPSLAVGLANGLVAGFAQGLILTTHPSVGSGTGVIKLVASPAFPFLQTGLAGVGITGLSSVQLATAISLGLVVFSNSFTLPIPIVGSASPTASSGVGVGKIV